jgi:hypothetical protein
MWELEPISIHTASRWLHRDTRSPEATFVVDSAYGELYIISIQAFDEELAKQGRTRMLWQTKVSCPAQGLDMAPSLKQMAREAAPYFGKETTRPVWTSAPLRSGHVDIGELKTLETIDPAKLPITDVEFGADSVAPAPSDSEKKPLLR